MNSVKGSVTIYAALIFSIVMSLFLTIIESARTQGARVMVSMAGSLALDTLFSGFERELLEQYGVLLFDGGNGSDVIDYAYLKDKVTEGISYNLNGDEGLIFVDSADFYNVNIDEVEITNVITSDMECGLIWRTMINDYAKIDYSVSLLEEILQIETVSEQSERVNLVVDSMSECYDSVATISSNYLYLVELLDGIKCGDKGINFNNLKTKTEFVKKLCPMEVFNPTMEVISISDSRIYNAVCGEIFDVNYYFQDFLAQYKKCFSEDHSLIDGLILKADVLRNFLSSEQSIIKSAMDTINAINASNSSLPLQIESARNILESIGNSIDITFYENISQDLNSLEADRLIWEEKGAQLSAIYKVLEGNYQVVSETYNLCPDIAALDAVKSDTLTDKEYYDMYEGAAEVIKGYRTDGMYLDYSGLEMSSEEADGSILDVIYSYAKDGILGLVIPSGSEISKKSISFNNLTSDCAERGDRDAIIEDSLSSMANEMLFNVYIYDKYSNFADNSGKGVLDYELEYIVFGNSADKDNLFSAVTSIAGIRLGCNLLNIYTDAEKKAQAASLAVSLIGAIGIPLLVKGLEYTILTAWAIGETVVDIRCLLAGEKLPLIKSKDDWRLSLDNLIKFNFSVEKRESDKGLGYAEYLCGVMLFKDGQEKAYRSMDMVELNMMGAGIADFRIRNYIYGMEVRIMYHLGNSKKQYTEYCVYTY